MKGIALGMIFAIISFIGVGSHAPLGEEAKGVRTQQGRLIGKAAILSLTMVGAALTTAAYALTVGWGQDRMALFARAAAPGVQVFLHYLGPVGAIALVVLAINSALMDDLALMTSSSRVLYAIARDRLLQTSFAVVNGRRAPAGAISFVGGAAAVIGVTFGLVLLSLSLQVRNSVEIGEEILVYVTRARGIAALVEAREPITNLTRSIMVSGNMYECTLPVNVKIVVDEQFVVKIRPLVEELSVTKRNLQNWGAMFQRSVLRSGMDDFELLKSTLEEASRIASQ